MSVSPGTKRALAQLSGNRCAMPDCGLRLVDAQGISVGIAAHIAGARGRGKQGSPSARFAPSMTDDERNALGNLIYVCRNCHEKIDAIPQGERDYPVARLIDIKAKHEGIVDRAMNEALASVSFAELEHATQWATEEGLEPSSERDYSRISIEDKIKKHGLSASSRSLIAMLLGAAPLVRSYIQAVSQGDPRFPDRLKARFLERYFRLRGEGITSGDELFVRMRELATRGFQDQTTEIAALAVLVYLFEMCEVFEQ